MKFSPLSPSTVHLALCVSTLSTLQTSEAAASKGNSGCPCVEWAGLDTYITGTGTSECINYSPGMGMTPPVGETNFCYPVDYGSGACESWDKTLQPFCADSSGALLPNAPAWCGDSFCYVDKNNCDQIVGKSGMFPDEDLYYSYATCGGKSSFDDWLDEQNPNLQKIAEIVENYVLSSVDVIEAAYLNSEEVCFLFFDDFIFVDPTFPFSPTPPPSPHLVCPGHIGERVLRLHPRFMQLRRLFPNRWLGL